MSFDQSVDKETQDKQHQDRPDEMSGQWIRDQLKDTADAAPAAANVETMPDPAEADAPVAAEDDPLSPMIANLANSISEAVVEPLESFERERRKETDAIANSVKEHDHRITAAFAALQQVEEASRRLASRVEEQEQPTRETREIVDRLQGRSEELQSEIRREAEQMSSSLGSLRSELEGFAQRLSHAEVTIEKQRAVTARLEALERRRAESLGEMARLMGNVQQALQPVGGEEEAPQDSSEG